MTNKEYTLKLERHDERIKLYSYKDEDRTFKSSAPTTNQDREIIRTLAELMDRLNLDKLKIKLEIE